MDLNLLIQYRRALDRAVALLARRAHSEGEIRMRLEKAQFDHEVIELVVFKLQKEHLLDDREFARQWVDSRVKKYGTARIRQELRLKNVDRNIAEEALSAASEEEQLECATAFARKKLHSSMHDSSDRRKTFRSITSALVRRGYSWDVARKAFELAGGNETDS